MGILSIKIPKQPGLKKSFYNKTILGDGLQTNIFYEYSKRQGTTNIVLYLIKSPTLPVNQSVIDTQLPQTSFEYTELDSPLKKDKYKDKSIPSFYYYEGGDFWCIGKKDTLKYIKHSLGLSFIYYLLENKSQRFYSLTVYNRGKHIKSDCSISKNQVEMDHSTLKVPSRQQIVELSSENIKKIQDTIDELKEKINERNYIDQDDFVEKQHQLYLLEKYLQERQMIFSDKDTKRTTVLKNNQRALIQIHDADLEIEHHLNDRTIICKNYQWFYQPKIEVNWILSPPQLSS